MFGLMKIKEYKKQLDKIEKLLELEKLRSTYWNLRYINPNINPVIAGSKEDIEYITRSITISSIEEIKK